MIAWRNSIMDRRTSMPIRTMPSPRWKTAPLSGAPSAGLPQDPWLRTHVRAGGTIIKVASCSMVIAGTLAEWRAWTGLRFEKSGPVALEGGLVPLHVSVEQDHAVYVEPNVWVHHRV